MSKCTDFSLAWYPYIIFDLWQFTRWQRNSHQNQSHLSIVNHVPWSSFLPSDWLARNDIFWRPTAIFYVNVNVNILGLYRSDIDSKPSSCDLLTIYIPGIGTLTNVSLISPGRIQHNAAQSPTQLMTRLQFLLSTFDQVPITAGWPGRDFQL